MRFLRRFWLLKTVLSTDVTYTHSPNMVLFVKSVEMAELNNLVAYWKNEQSKIYDKVFDVPGVMYFMQVEEINVTNCKVV